jgi:GT2 family glycosyltransferase
MKQRILASNNPWAKRTVSLAKGWKKDNREYQTWIKKIEPKLFGLSKKNYQEDTPDTGPLISIVVPCYNTPEKYLIPLIESVTRQTYQNWQLCIVDGSDISAIKLEIKDLSSQDNRIQYIDAKKNFGIAGNTNIGIKYAKGEYIGFLDHDDTLSPYALSEVVKLINVRPEFDLIYTDEDKLSDDGKERSLPFFKPDWSPDLMLGVNYVTHFVVAKKSIIEDIGGLRIGFDGAQDYDFLLRFTEKTNKIAHIPKILYHWRLADGSTSKNVGEKNQADSAGRKALSDAVERRKIKADVMEVVDRPTNYRLKYKLPLNQPKVSIIIPFKDKVELLKQCVESILSKTTYDNYEIILISNNSVENKTHNYLKLLEENNKCKIYFWDFPFNYSAINNFGSSKASGEYIALLNNDTKVLTPEWLEELIGVALQPGVGAVGPLLYYPNETIQHAGIIVGMGGMAGHVFRHRLTTDWTDFGMPAWPRDYLAVTGACLVIEHSKYKEVKGLDETFIVAGNDVALCIKIHELGYRNIFWPFAELLHYENVTVGSYDNGIQLDYERSLIYYRPYLSGRDPYFNINLDLMNEQIGLELKDMSNVISKAIYTYRKHGLKKVARKVKTTAQYRLKLLNRFVPRRSKTITTKELKEEYNFISNKIFQITESDIAASKKHTHDDKLKNVLKANWFVPNFDHLSFGGIFTIFRFIEKFSSAGVHNCIIIYDNPYFDTEKLEKDIASKFPKLKDYEIIIFDPSSQELDDLPSCDIAVCSFWVSAYLLLKFNKTKRKYYFIQDYEPLFYPAGSTYALAESTYRFGFIGIVNTPGLLAAVNQRHGTEGVSFIPAVDQTQYRPLAYKREGHNIRVFFYARPNNPRNAFNLGIEIIKSLIEKYGNKIEIITAGSNWLESEYGLKGKITNHGLLKSINEVADLYRNCDIGFVYMLSKHPSYQPFEFMASGMATVTNKNEDNLWLLKDGVNCLLSEPSPAAMVEKISILIEDKSLREKIVSNAYKSLGYTWEQQTEMIWNYIKNN